MQEVDISTMLNKATFAGSKVFLINHIRMFEPDGHRPDIVSNKVHIIRPSEINNFMDQHFVIDAKTQPRAFNDELKQLKLYRTDGYIDYYLFPKEDYYQEVKKYVSEKQVIPSTSVLPSRRYSSSRSPTRLQHTSISRETPATALLASNRSSPTNRTADLSSNRSLSANRTSEVISVPPRSVVHIPAGTTVSTPATRGKTVTLSRDADISAPRGTSIKITSPTTTATNSVPFQATTPLVVNGSYRQ